MNLAELANRARRAVAEAIARGVARRSKQPLPVHPKQRRGPPPIAGKPPLPKRSPALEEIQRMMNLVESGQATGAKAEDIARRLIPMLQRAISAPGLSEANKRVLGQVREALDAWEAKKAQQYEEEDEIDVQPLGRADVQQWPQEYRDFRLDQRMTMTPGSSNVHSFTWFEDTPQIAYGTRAVRAKRPGPEDNGTLVVTFKEWHPGSEDRPNAAGATYAYSNVPRSKWNQFLAATSPDSAGIAVWDYLRLRGTQSGHQHPYRLLSVSGDYVPRKATSQGYATRHLPGGAEENVAWRRSTLPSGPRVDPLGNPVVPEPRFSYGTARTLAPERNAAAAERRNRGEPNRGQPNNGRR